MKLLRVLQKLADKILDFKHEREVRMVLLQSMDKFDELAELNMTSGKLTFYSKTRHPDKANVSMQGGYSTRLGGLNLVLYRIDNVLHFRADDISFILDDKTVVTWERGPVFNKLKIERNEMLKFTFSYPKPQINPSLSLKEDVITSFSEEEDFDFGLFVYNVTKNPKRKAEIFTSQ